jgi:penicillin-binding protein 2
VPDGLQIELAERAEEFPGVQVARESVRAYPNGPLAAHLVGYVGRVSEEELEARMGTKESPKPADKPYQPDSDIGKAGVERTFEDDLRGVPGVRRIEIDAKGTPIRTIEYSPPRPGNDLQLALDLDVQANAESTLAAQLDAVRGGATKEGTKTAQAGSVVAIDPRNGEVLAMASFPTYDPAEFVNGISTERYQELVGGGDPADNPFPNRAISGEYAPGSTFKLVTAYAGLDAGLVTASSPFYDSGCLQVGDRPFCNAGKAAHGAVPMPRALTVSSDTYFYSLGQRFWAERDQHGDGIQDAARGFGFGTASGVQLPGESAGIIPDPDYKRRLWESLPPDQQAKGDPAWYPGDNVNLSIGQGYVLSTPIQLVNGYATFVNKGRHHQPNVALRVLIPAGDPADPAAVVKVFEPRVDHTLEMPDTIYEPVHDGMLGVASSREGTAYDAFRSFDLDEFPIFSKTGTAQVNGKADNALFAACGPDPEYRICAAAVLEQAGFGGEAAAPVVRRVLEPVAGQLGEDWQPGIVRGSD